MVEFWRVPSKANVADAVSRDDFSRARREGWVSVQLETTRRLVNECFVTHLLFVDDRSSQCTQSAGVRRCSLVLPLCLSPYNLQACCFHGNDW